MCLNLYINIFLSQIRYRDTKLETGHLDWNIEHLISHLKYFKKKLRETH